MVDDGRTTNDGRTTEHGYTISSPCEPDSSGELKNAVSERWCTDSNYFFILSNVNH